MTHSTCLGTVFEKDSMNHTEFSAYTPGILSVIRGVNTLFRKRPANLVHD